MIFKVLTERGWWMPTEVGFQVSDARSGGHGGTLIYGMTLVGLLFHQRVMRYYVSIDYQSFVA